MLKVNGSILRSEVLYRYRSHFKGTGIGTSIQTQFPLCNDVSRGTMQIWSLQTNGFTYFWCNSLPRFNFYCFTDNVIVHTGMSQ